MAADIARLDPTDQFRLLLDTAEAVFHLGDRVALYDALGVVADFHAWHFPEEAVDAYGLACLYLERRLAAKGIEADI